MATAKAIPDRCTAVTPHLIVRKSGAEAIEFYKKAFGAEEIYRLPGPGGTIMHAEIRIGNAVIFLCESGPGMEVAWASGAQWPAITLHHYVEDARAAYKRAVDAGCTVNMPLADMFWGDRYGKVTDPYGHVWAIAQHLEDLAPEQMNQRAAEAFAQM